MFFFTRERSGLLPSSPIMFYCQGTSERGDERKDVHGNTIKKALLLAVLGGGNLVLLVLVYGWFVFAEDKVHAYLTIAFDVCQSILVIGSRRTHVWYIYLHWSHKESNIYAGKHTDPMDLMGTWSKRDDQWYRCYIVGYTEEWRWSTNLVANATLDMGMYLCRLCFYAYCYILIVNWLIVCFFCYKLWLSNCICVSLICLSVSTRP